MVDAAWRSNSVRTDSVNLGICISFVTSAMIFLAISIRSFLVLVIQKI